MALHSLQPSTHNSDRGFSLDDISSTTKEMLEHLHRLSALASGLKPTGNNNGNKSILSHDKRSRSWLPSQRRRAQSQAEKDEIQSPRFARSQSEMTFSNPNARSGDSHLIQKLNGDLHYMINALERLKKFESYLFDQLNHLKGHVCEMIEEMEKKALSDPDHIHSELLEMSKEVVNLKRQIPVFPDALYRPNYRPSRNGNGGIDDLLGLHMDPEFPSSSAFKEVQEKFLSLDISRKLCLLSFAVFPENSEIVKRMLLYWWIGEDFLPVEDAEEKLNEILQEFTKKGLIETVKKGSASKPNSIKMAPLVRSAVIVLAKHTGFLDIYDEEGKPTMKKSDLKKLCLVEGSSKQLHQKLSDKELGDLETLFNISERFPDFTFKWFSKMKSLKVLYLGRWKESAEHHVEVESMEFMKDLISMTKLRFLSLQGISKITELPSSIFQLPNLTILDLRGCHNLEELPDNIDWLKNLTYLDMSGCYLLDRMPKKLSRLSELRLLKGFVIGEASDQSTCTLDELTKIQKLRTLSIRISRESFKSEALISALEKFVNLQSLKVAWGGRASANQNELTESSKRQVFVMKDRKAKHSQPRLPHALKRLELQCFPETKLPSWLEPENLGQLHKLDILGGNLRKLRSNAESKGNDSVEVLLLKYLPHLKVEWRELQALFPKLKVLEAYECPNVRLSPCDISGTFERPDLNNP